MLAGVHPLLTGALLAHLDAMGHSDTVVVADAHFPVARLGARTVDLPTLPSPEVVRAVRTVLPLDDAPALDLMTSADGTVLPVQHELITAAGAEGDGHRFVPRHDFYALAGEAFVILRTGETRVYGNAALRKGVVTVQDAPWTVA